MLYNPLTEKIARTIQVPQYYTDVANIVMISEKEGKKVQMKLNRKYEIELSVNMQPESYT